ncbi:MAG: YicC family protein [Bacteroidetes bacterium]|nr:YicC family protein [Bacteroidota bacterium]MCK5765117.1 YicC family protein [Bacteroidales bacterium]
MIKSMTGFGRSTLDLPERSISIDVKSLNSKQFDAYLRLPPLYREKEGELRLLLNNELERGKIELNINIDKNGETGVYQFNRVLAKQYYTEIKALAEELNLEMNDQVISTITKMPDVLKAEQASLSEEEWLQVRKAVKTAIDKLNDFRIKEGAALEKDLLSRAILIEKLLEKIPPLEEKRITHMRERLKKQLEDYLQQGTVDMNRFEQEVVYYMEKLDITEEKVRLKKHCSYFAEILAEQGSNGKKLGFISQEMGREINTLGSKANDADIQKIVVLMKDELEKIKEQLFNIL